MKKSHYKFYILSFVFLLFCSCASNTVKNTSTKNGGNSIIPSGEMTSKQIQEQVKIDIAQLKNSNDYVLQSGDLIDIAVFNETDMNRTQRISGNGYVTLPLIGVVKISGLSVTDAELEISNKLKKYIKQPHISIFVKEYCNTTVYVLGQVKNPSAIQIPPGRSLTILEAITSVGGFTNIASTKVKVLRTEKGKQKSIEVDISQITKQGKKDLDIVLMPSDIVFVPQSMF